MQKIVTYMGIKIASIYKGKFVASWEDIWLPKRKGTKVKTQAWTKGPQAQKLLKVLKYGMEEPPKAVATYKTKDSGSIYQVVSDGYDTQPKSLGKWMGQDDDGYRYYSKRTKDIDGSASKQRPRMLQVPPKDIEAYIPVGDFYSEKGEDYGLECMEESYQYYDAEAKVVKYMPQWKPVYTDAEREERSHWRRSVPTYEQIEVEELGDYGFVESEY